ncbi:hypothetical protein [Jannaschia pohangensis]|uniref:Uncharacterized protein n=1 Tax=Jannaschia pohangensis TaxID=390807 RepID=A0A1I3H4S9_9RHOB|nr:hypothetical protein [Jannaschia pohangensis]SFI30653.1 hypothetical protein SAMN04488095_0449 [Jannaschia pohangensis]
MPVDHPTFLSLLSRECRSSANDLAHVQDAIGDHAALPELAVELAHDLQALDRVSQTLNDLGAMFEAMARSNLPIGEKVQEDILHAISQATLRARLSGLHHPARTEHVELF